MKTLGTGCACLAMATLLAQSQQGTPSYSVPRVDAAGGGNTSQGPGQTSSRIPGRGGGIRFVTRPTPTASSATMARDFFSASGVDLGSRQQAANPPAPAQAVVTAGRTPGANASPKTTVPGGAVSMGELSALVRAAQRGDVAAKTRLAELAPQLAGEASGRGSDRPPAGPARVAGQVR